MTGTTDTMQQLGKRNKENGGQIGPVRVGLASCGH